MPRVAIVECTVVLSVPLPDDADYDPQFDIEENHCPGTGIVGVALDAAIADGNRRGVCWACPTGKNRILEIKGTP